jgi:hypothetical protein
MFPLLLKNASRKHKRMHRLHRHLLTRRLIETLFHFRDVPQQIVVN